MSSHQSWAFLKGSFIVKLTTCMSCGSKAVVEFIDLGLQPSGNAFLTSKQTKDEPLYLLRMGVCKNCWQVQLLDHLEKKDLFEDHPYLTGSNIPIVEHFENLAEQLINRYSLTNADLVLDIGCNDGTLLDKFKKQGLSTIGVEPSSRISAIAREKGHVVANTFWGSDTASALNALCIKPKMITAMSVFYHVSDLHDFLNGVELVMNTDTLFVIQAVSLLSLLKKNQFDHFYHEHTCIHSLSSLQEILDSHELKIINIEDTEVHGGAFIAILAHRNSTYTVSRNIYDYANKEEQEGLKQIETYNSFGKRAKEIAVNLRLMLVKLKAERKRVYGLGAPLKSSTFLNFADIDSSLIECLTEVNQLKIGKLSPGKHIPVIDEKSVSNEPDYYVVFAWNYLDYLIDKKMEYLKSGGKLIVPFPELRIISIDDL